MRLTHRGRVLATAAVVLAATGRFFAVIELFMSAGGVVVLLAAARGYVRLTPVQIAGERRLHPQRPQAGDPIEVRVELRNYSKRSAPALFATDRLTGGRTLVSPVEPLAPGATVRFAYTMPSLARGRHEVGPLAVTLRDPFGLLERSFPVVAASMVTVVPRRCQVDASGLRTAQRGVGVAGHRPRRGDGGEFRALRDYRSGDELRAVCWKGSARRGTLVVREENAGGVTGRVTILLDDRRHLYRDADFEQAVSAAASIACSAAYLGPVQLACGGVMSSAGAGPSKVEHLLEMLAAVQVRPAAQILRPDRLNRLDRAARMGADVLVVVTTTSVSGAELAGVAQAFGRPGLLVVVACHSRAGPASPAPELPSGARLVAMAPGATVEAAWARAVPTVPQVDRRPPVAIGRR